jgi:protein ImuA
VGALSEILQAHTGQHEWRLLLPALTQGRGPVVLVGAPHLPFGPGLAAQGLDARRLLWVRSDTPAQRLWASEQALRCAEVLAVLAWLPQVRAEQLRRLQMAAQTHGKLLFVMRPAPAQAESSPALLRLLVTGSPRDAPVDALSVQVIKRRGPPLAQPLILLARHARLAALLALSEGPGAGIDASILSAGGPHALDRLAAAA